LYAYDLKDFLFVWWLHKSGVISQQQKFHGPFGTCKALPGFFPLYFQLHYLPEETCFQQGRSSAVEGTSQAVLGSSNQRKVPASLSLSS
jgi:hypothetical protein